MTNQFIGRAARLCDGDIDRAAAELGCDRGAILAVVHVESAGGGFLPDGRPKILFEATVFHRLTGGRYDQSAPDISSPTWNRALYKGGAAEYDRLMQAMALDEAAALQSASWGMFQVMGGNFNACGFATVQDFVTAMVDSEGAQLEAFVAFVKSSPAMAQALAAHDWAGFARRYNGPGYAANHYDIKLASAYALAGTTALA
ncbi:MAG: N-acetylmuramidase family protein [Pseudomonadota bacterium]